mmetsp:Transcript_15453/g.23331  ORF Transcript_15453/g.23331 Transcript_15453/m.23331 type:complete len:244 (+) Transcript_15453:39-770(+)
MTMCSMSVLGMVLFVLCCPVSGLLADDRIVTHTQTVHAGWKTPWIELSINEMPLFLRDDTVLSKPNLPRENENTRDIIWDSTKDIRMSFTFSNNQLVIPSVHLYQAHTHQYIDKLIVILEHDNHEIVRVRHKVEYKDLDSLYPPPFEMVYKWRAVREDDLPLGIKAMFLMAIVLFCGLVAVVYVTYDRDNADPRRRISKPSSYSSHRGGARSNSTDGSSPSSGGRAGIHVKKRSVGAPGGLFD